METQVISLNGVVIAMIIAMVITVALDQCDQI